MFIDDVADTMSIGALGGAGGTALIQYDGGDNNISLDPAGLGSISLAGGSPGDPLDPGAGLIITTSAQDAGDSLFIQVYSPLGSSTATIPVAPGGLSETVIRFTDFATATGSGADFNNVGAIEASVGLSIDNDITVSIAEAREANIVTANTANILPVSLGGRIFSDSSDVGQNNGFREGTEAGLNGVTVELYKLVNADDVVNPATTALTSFTTATGGTFNFGGLDPGHYAVVVPASQFAGWCSSIRIRQQYRKRSGQ